MRKKILLMSILLQMVLLIPISKGSATDENNYQYNLTELAQVDTNGAAFDVEILGDMAFIADFAYGNPGGLVIVNVSDPANPMRLSNYYDGVGTPRDVCVSDGLAFVADDTDGLEVVNITDPLNPQEIITGYNDAGMVNGVKVRGDVAFVSDHLTGLHILNISDPTNLTRINLVSLWGACVDIEIVGDFAYTIDHREYQSGLQILDISDIHNVMKLGSYMPAADFINPHIINDLAIVANHKIDTGELRILDISNPASIQELCQYKGESVAQKFDSVNQTLCMTDSTSGIKLLDISNSSEPFLIGKYFDGSGCSFDVKIIDNIAFVADGPDGLEIVQISINENYQTPTSKLSTPIIFLIIFGLSITVAHYCVKRKKEYLVL